MLIAHLVACAMPDSGSAAQGHRGAKREVSSVRASTSQGALALHLGLIFYKSAFESSKQSGCGRNLGNPKTSIARRFVLARGGGGMAERGPN